MVAVVGAATMLQVRELGKGINAQCSLAASQASERAAPEKGSTFSSAFARSPGPLRCSLASTLASTRLNPGPCVSEETRKDLQGPCAGGREKRMAFSFFQLASAFAGAAAVAAAAASLRRWPFPNSAVSFARFCFHRGSSDHTRDPCRSTLTSRARRGA